jgi:hypothetical protein
LRLFVENIRDSFPELKEVLEDYYKPLLEVEVCNEDKYVKRYMRKMKEYSALISNKNNDLFNESIFILKNIDFKTLWESDELSDKNKDTIWEYIQTLYILGETIIGDADKVLNLVNNFKKIKDGEFDEKDANIDGELLDMFKSLSENKNTSPIDDNFLSECSLGKLASELTSEINLEEMNLGIDENSNMTDMFSNLMSGDNSLNFMNLIQKVGQKIQNKVESGDFNQEKLMDEAKHMMAGLQGGGGGGGSDMFASMAAAMGGGGGGGGGMGDMAAAMAAMGGGGDMASAMAAMGGGGDMAPAMSGSSDNPTRDRLKKKLEKRQNKK